MLPNERTTYTLRNSVLSVYIQRESFIFDVRVLTLPLIGFGYKTLVIVLLARKFLKFLFSINTRATFKNPLTYIN